MTNKTVFLEKNIPFSKSMMWHDQKRYYAKKGIDAWSEDVPFYITSNPYIGKSYAFLALSFMQDWIKKNKDSAQATFYIVELGAGTGQFSFYFIKHLIALRKIFKLEHLSFHYVMSDLSDKSFDFWGTHPALKPYIDAGILDFTAFDMYRSDAIHLHHSKKIVSPNNNKNPMIFIANYLFDSIATDVFTVRNGTLFESNVTLETDEDNIKEGMPLSWEKVKIGYHETAIEKNYYHNEFDTILFNYANTLVDTTFQFPIASLQALKKIQTLSNNQFLLLSSDKGYTQLDEMDHCDYPELDFHGSFSVMVNYHAIAEFLKMHQGDACLQAFREHIATGVFSSGFQLNDFTQLHYAISEKIHGFSPTDYFILYEDVAAKYKKCSLETLASYLNLSQWDPYLFDHVAEYICELAEDAEPDVIAFLEKHLPDIADNFYYLPHAEDTFFNIGVFFQNIGQFEKAIAYYDQSEKYFGKDDVVLFNKGMCYYSLDQNDAAITCLQEAQNLNVDAVDAKKWIDVIRHKK